MKKSKIQSKVKKMSFDDVEDDPFADEFDVDDPFDVDTSMDVEEQEDDEEEKSACIDFEVLRSIGTELKTISGNKYWSRDPNEMMRWAQLMASQLSQHLNLTYSQTWALLDRYDFDPNKVLSKYEQDFEALQKVLEACGGEDEDFDEDGTTKEDDIDIEKVMECPVCYDDKSQKDFISRTELRCGHTNICKTCFGDYISKSAKDKKGLHFDRLSVLKMKCPMLKCSCPLTMETIERYASPQLIEKRNLWISEDIALKSLHLSSCTKCERTFEFIKTKDEVLKMPLETGELSCLCGHVRLFLFLFRERGHVCSNITRHSTKLQQTHVLSGYRYNAGSAMTKHTLRVVATKSRIGLNSVTRTRSWKISRNNARCVRNAEWVRISATRTHVIT